MAYESITGSSYGSISNNLYSSMSDDIKSDTAYFGVGMMGKRKRAIEAATSIALGNTWAFSEPPLYNLHFIKTCGGMQV